MKIIKFGGKSLGNGLGIQNVLSIVASNYEQGEEIALVVSARGNSTNWLETLLEKAQKGLKYKDDLKAFQAYQCAPFVSDTFQSVFAQITAILQKTELVKTYDQATKDLLLAQGEILSALLVSSMLNQLGISAQYVDSRHFFVTDSNFGAANLNDKLSSFLTKRYFELFPQGVLPVVTGFVASNLSHATTTLGRNGSNYSASLLAKYLSVKVVESYTDVDGIFTANPHEVSGATLIPTLTFEEAETIAKSGVGILHEKTIQPLREGEIPLRILNSFNLSSSGTWIGGRK